MYKAIKAHPPLYQIYAKRIGMDDAAIAAQAGAVKSEYEAAQKSATQVTKKPLMRDLPNTGTTIWRPLQVVLRTTPRHRARGVGGTHRAFDHIPEGFHIHPKVKKLLEQRQEMGKGKKPLDYGMAEALAFASLVKHGILCDSADRTRGARPSISGTRCCSILRTNRIRSPAPHCARQAACDIINSTLSEAGVMGFEYGYSRDYPEALVCGKRSSAILRTWRRR